MLAKMKSRKFIVCLLGTIAPVVASYLTGEIAIGEALQLSTAAVCSYLFGQSFVDGKTAENSAP